jgi:hypothetical protein
VLAVRSPATVEAPTLAAETLQPVTLTTMQRPGTTLGTTDSYVVPTATSAPSAAIPASRLTNYVVAHSEFSSPLGRHNMMTGLLTEGSSTTEEVATADPTSRP